MSTAVPSRRPHRTAAEVNAAGLRALIAALGVADAARFLQQYGPGLGNYTAERDALLEGLSSEDVMGLAEQHDRAPDA